MTCGLPLMKRFVRAAGVVTWVIELTAASAARLVRFCSGVCAMLRPAPICSSPQSMGGRRRGARAPVVVPHAAV
eukprot:1978996-Prymnesium_polylepis.1